MPVLRAHGLIKTVGSGRARRRVLDGVGLAVAAGEVVAVLGRSGSGKSTLLHLLGGLDQPDHGEIELAGERLPGRGGRALARMRLRHVGFVCQQFALIEECTGAENVLLHPAGRRPRRRRAARGGSDGGARTGAGGRPSAPRALRRRAAALRPRPGARQRSPSSCSPTSRNVVAYPGDHTVFEAPPLVAGPRLRGAGQTEVGDGLAQTLGLAPDQTIALGLSSRRELRLRVAGVVSSLDHDGRVAYVPAAALLRADPSASSKIVIRLSAGTDEGRVNAALLALGAVPATAGGATSRGAPLVAVLRTILRAVAVVDGLGCLYALVQACALTVSERRRTVAVLRACGAGTGAVARLLLGAAVALVVPAALLGAVLERYVLGPAMSNLAASYATLPLRAGALELALTTLGLLAAAALAVAWVSRQAGRESVLAGLAA